MAEACNGTDDKVAEVVEVAKAEDAEPVAVKKDVSEPKTDQEFFELVFNLEAEKAKVIEEAKTKLRDLSKKLEESNAENEALKKKNAQLEQTMMQKTALKNEIGSSKHDVNEVLVKAKSLLFEKTKVCKQQEQQIELLKNQVESIKDVLAITKDMLNLRNTEVEHLQTRLDTIDLRVKAEKDNRGLLEKKLAISQQMFADMRKEYDCQSTIFKELRASYEQKIKILESELEKAKSGAS